MRLRHGSVAKGSLVLQASKLRLSVIACEFRLAAIRRWEEQAGEGEAARKVCSYLKRRQAQEHIADRPPSRRFLEALGKAQRHEIVRPEKVTRESEHSNRPASIRATSKQR